MRLVCASCLVASLLGMVIVDLLSRDFKLALISFLLAIVNILIFIVK